MGPDHPASWPGSRIVPDLPDGARGCRDDPRDQSRPRVWAYGVVRSRRPGRRDC